MINYIIIYLFIGFLVVIYDVLSSQRHRQIYLNEKKAVMIYVVLAWPMLLMNRFKLIQNRSRPLFSNDTVSVYKSWVDSNIKFLNSSKKFNKDNLFGAVVIIICQFSLPNEIESQTERIPLKEDLSFFELGCFMLATYKVWLKRNYPNECESLCRDLVSDFSILSEPLVIDEGLSINEMIESRIKIYIQLYSENILGTTTDLLATLVYRGHKDGKLVTEMINDNELILDFKMQFFKMGVMSWYTSYMGTGFDNLEKYCKENI